MDAFLMSFEERKSRTDLDKVDCNSQTTAAATSPGKNALRGHLLFSHREPGKTQDRPN